MALMEQQSADRVRDLRSRVRAERAILAGFEGQPGGSYMKHLIQRASNTLDDVESFFLGSLERESRTPVNESKWLDYAERVFDQIAVPQRKLVQDIVSQYGPSVIAIPSPRP